MFTVDFLSIFSVPGMAAKTVAGPNRNPEASPAANNNAAGGKKRMV